MRLTCKVNKCVKNIINNYGYEILKKDNNTYCFDGLFTRHNSSFMQDPSFVESYKYSIKKVGADYQWYWRTHIGMSVAMWAINRGGAFAECGVGKGAMSSLILKKLSLHLGELPYFYLFDTFEGIDPALVSEEEEAFWGTSKETVAKDNEDTYGGAIDEIRKKYLEWPNVRIFKGSVPAVLEANAAEIEKNRFSFIHIDMNNATPEVAAVDFFIDKLTRPGFILFDDYAYCGHEFQKLKLDEVAQKYGFFIASFPTGQGLAVIG